MLKTALSVTALAALFCSPLTAASIEEADALWDIRGESYNKGGTIEEKAANVIAAQNMYKELIATETDVFQKIYMGGQVARAYHFIIDYVMPLDESVYMNGKNRKDYADECFDYMDVIGPDKVGRNQPYHYGKLMCKAYSAQLAGLFEKLAGTKYFEEGGPDDLLYTGLALGDEFQGGGILRTVSQVRSNPLAVAIGQGDMGEALEAAENALAISESSEYDRFGNTGPDYCDNWLSKIYVLVALEDWAAAENTMIDTLDYFWVEGGADDFEILVNPKGLEIDTQVCVSEIFEIAETNAEINL